MIIARLERAANYGVSTMAPRNGNGQRKTKDQPKDQPKMDTPSEAITMMRHLFYTAHTRVLNSVVDDATLQRLFDSAPESADDAWYVAEMDKIEAAMYRDAHKTEGG